MITEIPLRGTVDVDDFTIVTALDGVPFVLSFSYSASTDRWYFGCADAKTGKAIVSGVPCCAEYPLLAGVIATGRPAGELQFMALVDPGRNDLGSAARLLYFDAAEIA